MVKINLKTASPIKKEASGKEFASGPKPEKPGISASDSEDFSFETTESLIPRSDESGESPADSFVAELEELEEPEKTKEKFPEEEGENDFTFSKSSPRNKLYLIYGAVAVLAIIALILILNLLKGRGVSEKQPVPSQKPVAEKPGEQPQAGTVQNQTLLSIYQKNKATNAFLLQQLQRIISQKPKSAEYSLIVVTTSEISLTVLADSRDQIARFHIDLKKTFPQLPFQIISVQSKYENGKKKFYADLTAKIRPSRISAAGQPVAVGAQPRNIEHDLRQLAQSSRVKMVYLKRGKIYSRPDYEEIQYYVNLNGKKENIIRFTSALVSGLPMVKIDKLAIYPYNLSVISDKNLSTRMSLTFFNRK